MKLLTTLSAFLLATCGLFSQNIYRVDAASQAVFPTGTSWNLAFQDLQTALGIAEPGDEIWVAQGIYKPTTGMDRHVRFVLPSGVGVYGGFGGTELVRDARDWVANQSILSGDIGVPGDSTDNTFCLVYAAATDSNTVIDGLIIERANANNTLNNTNWYRPTLSGAGIYLDADGGLFGTSYLSVFNCTVRKNTAFYQAGGIYANGRGNGAAILRMENCLIQRNRAGFYGAGMALENYTNNSPPLEIIGCNFLDNHGPSTGGGAMLISHRQAVMVRNCQFLRNKSFNYGAVYFIYQSNHEQPIAFEDCIFEENAAATAAAIQLTLQFPTLSTSLRISRCRFFAQLGGTLGLQAGDQDHIIEVENSIFSSNVGTGNALYFESGTNGVGYFTNCLFYKNWYSSFRGSPNLPSFFVTNTIIIDEEADPSPVLANNVQTILEHCMTNVNSCNLLGASVMCDANSQFGLNPQFISPSPESTANFHLQPCSPAINAGLNAVLDPLVMNTDFDGNPRLLHGQVDIGPYETNLYLTPGAVVEPSCFGLSDGSITLNGNICAPYSLIWDNGSSTGTTLSGLAAGTYQLTITDAHGLMIQETVVLSEPDTLVLEATVQNIACNGIATGAVWLFTQGGTPFPGLPSYEYSPINPPSFNLPAGDYSYVVSDANSCSASVSVTIEAPPPFQFFYSVQDVSGQGACDGAITFDSIIGGWNGAPTPDDLTGLCSGVYGVTVADPNGCLAHISIIVGVTSDVDNPIGALSCNIFPNPTFSDEPLLIQTSENEGFKARFFDLSGRLLHEITSNIGSAELRLNSLPTGNYRVEIVGASGRRTSRPWLVKGR